MIFMMTSDTVDNVNYIIPLSKMTYFVCALFYRYDIDKPTPKLSAQVSTDSLRLI